MTRKRTFPPSPPTSVPKKRPTSGVPSRKPPSTLRAIQDANQRATGPSVLIIDDEDAIVETWVEILRREGLQIGWATNAAEAAEKFSEREWDVILTDLRLVDGDGVSIINEISKKAPGTISIVLTGFPT